jgi:DNA ligase (NAD+)
LFNKVLFFSRVRTCAHYAAGLRRFKSARNAAAGAMQRLEQPARDGTDAGPLRFLVYAWVGLHSLPGVRLVTWTTPRLAVISWCFDCKITW